jgi:Flp pilus assembly protein TadD
MKRLMVLALACLIGYGCGSPETTEDHARPEPAPSEAPASTGPSDAAPPESGDMGGHASAAVEQLLSDEAEPAAESEGLTRLRETVAEHPSDPQAHRRLGVALKSVGREGEALQHLERAADLAPDDPGVLLSLGIGYSGSRRLDEAEATYRRILAVEPGHSMALNNLGNIALRRGDESGATSWYRQAVEADPEYLRARHKLAGVLKYYGHLAEAYGIYERIQEMTPSGQREQHAQIDSLYSMGSINLSWNKPELAEQQLARVVRIVPTHRSAHYARAQALLVLGRHEEAQQELQMHLRILHASGEGF